jgi:hypothetical protein
MPWPKALHELKLYRKILQAFYSALLLVLMAPGGLLILMSILLEMLSLSHRENLRVQMTGLQWLD